jgi:sec-independent protein translocase protein TatA
MGSLGWPEILLIALVIVLLFGARKLPEIGRGLGEGIRSFRSAMRGDEGPPKDEAKGGSGNGSGGAGK